MPSSRSPTPGFDLQQEIRDAVEGARSDPTDSVRKRAEQIASTFIERVLDSRLQLHRRSSIGRDQLREVLLEICRIYTAVVEVYVRNASAASADVGEETWRAHVEEEVSSLRARAGEMSLHFAQQSDAFSQIRSTARGARLIATLGEWLMGEFLDRELDRLREIEDPEERMETLKTHLRFLPKSFGVNLINNPYFTVADYQQALSETPIGGHGEAEKIFRQLSSRRKGFLLQTLFTQHESLTREVETLAILELARQSQISLAPPRYPPLDARQVFLSRQELRGEDERQTSEWTSLVEQRMVGILNGYLPLFNLLAAFTIECERENCNPYPHPFLDGKLDAALREWGFHRDARPPYRPPSSFGAEVKAQQEAEKLTERVAVQTRELLGEILQEAAVREAAAEQPVMPVEGAIEFYQEGEGGDEAETFVLSGPAPALEPAPSREEGHRRPGGVELADILRRTENPEFVAACQELAEKLRMEIRVLYPKGDLRRFRALAKKNPAIRQWLEAHNRVLHDLGYRDLTELTWDEHVSLEAHRDVEYDIPPLLH